MADNVIGTHIDWALRREFATTLKDTKHYVGVVRCVLCGVERRGIVRTPIWAFGPSSVDCHVCPGVAVMVDPDSVEGETQPSYSVILVKEPEP